MNPRQLMAHIPDSGSRSVGELAKAACLDESEVRRLASGLQDSWLVTIEGDSVFPTDTLQMERGSGLLPRYCGGAYDVQSLEKASAVELAGAEEQVFTYMSLLWDGTYDGLRKHFRMGEQELDEVLSSLQKKSLIGFARTRKWGILQERCAKVANTRKADEFRAKFFPGVSADCHARRYRTSIDVLARLVESFSPLPLSTAASHLNFPAEKLLPIAEILHDKKIIRLRHKGAKSVLLSNPEIKYCALNGAVYSQTRIPCESAIKNAEVASGDSLGRVIGGYEIEKDGVRLEASIVSARGELKYVLSQPQFEPPTRAVMSRIYDDLSPGVWGQVYTSRDFEEIKARMMSNIGKALEERVPFVDDAVRRIMAVELINQLHLGRLEYLLRDPHVEEIKAQGGRPVFIRHVKCPQEWVETNISLSEDELGRYAKAIARQTSQQVDSSHPLMDAVLHTLDRVNVSLPEIAGGSTIMEIRVFSKSPWNFVRLIRKGTVDAETLAFLWLALQHKLNILVAGEAGSGKTSFITALSLFLPKNDHIISVEDTRELQLPGFFRNWSHLTVRRGNQESNVTMSRLLLNALRMDPSFIIMGEVRGAEDIQALMRATAMGHPVMSTIHTRDCSTAVKRFMDAGVPASDMANIHLIVILEAVKPKKESRQPKRRVREIGEYITAGAGADVNRIYRLDMGADEIKPVNEPRSFYQRIGDKACMSKDDIRRDLLGKKTVIDWVVNQGEEDIEVLGRVIQLYYHDPLRTVKAALKNVSVEEFLKNED